MFCGVMRCVGLVVIALVVWVGGLFGYVFGLVVFIVTHLIVITMLGLGLLVALLVGLCLRYVMLDCLLFLLDGFVFGFGGGLGWLI